MTEPLDLEAIEKACANGWPGRDTIAALLAEVRRLRAVVDDYDSRWQSAREVALEDAAKVAEGGRFLHDDAPTARFGRECAAAIRALKEHP